VEELVLKIPVRWNIEYQTQKKTAQFERSF